MALFTRSINQYSSSLYETARGLLRSRNNQAQRADRLAQQNRDLAALVKRQSEQLDTITQQFNQAQQQLATLQHEIIQLRTEPIQLPSDLPLPNHTYGPKMIALCLNLCRRIGFRPTVSSLHIFFDWLAIKAKIPSVETIRGWACRAGVAQLQRPVEAAEDWIWMADHSNQIGSEKVLQILGIRAADLPPTGQTLARDKLRVLAVIPGTVWKRDDVRREYRKLADRIGAPRFLLCDGAVELRESADALEKAEKKPIVLRDFKHFAANTFEQLIGKSERFTSYLSQLGRARCQVQQTELSHFAPPTQKPKARFMNLGPTLRWGQMISHHLSNYRSKARSRVPVARMNEKFGWVRGYRDDLATWNRCEAVMQTSLKFINEHGLAHGTSTGLQQALDTLTSQWPDHCQLSKTMETKLVEFVRQSESALGENERAWLSTENLESSFGMFKQLEGQQSKGGFTSLVAAMPMLLGRWTADRVRESFTAVSVKQTQAWIKENLGQTLTAKRRQAYQEFTAASG